MYSLIHKWKYLIENWKNFVNVKLIMQIIKFYDNCANVANCQTNTKLLRIRVQRRS